MKLAASDFRKQIDYLVWVILLAIGCGIVCSVSLPLCAGPVHIPRDQAQRANALHENRLHQQHLEVKRYSPMFVMPAYDPPAVAILGFGILAVISLPFIF